MKEKAASSKYYLVSDQAIRIESSKEGIQAFDEKNQLLGEQIASNQDKTEDPQNLGNLFELKNDLKKGTVELSKKDVSTGELLPKTGVRILDKDQKIIAEGRTDENGLYTFKQLPAGTYYFQEFDPPAGYQLDDTPMKFEIKEDGEIVKCEMTNKKIPEPVATSTLSLPQTGSQASNALLVAGCVLSLSSLRFFLKKKKSA